MSQFKLVSDDEGYYLEDRFSRQKPLRIQFNSPEYLHRLQDAGKRSELILRSVRAAPGLKVLDCTAGLGRDAFLLAHKGCEVTMLERSTVLATMLADAITRATRVEGLADTTQRLNLHRTDARCFLGALACPAEDQYQPDQAGVSKGKAFDVIYIDPMFPIRGKSALVKGEMQLLQRFLGVDEDAAELISLAFATGSPRLVVKRPAQGPWKSPVPPTVVFTGKTSRFEVIAPVHQP